MKNSVLKSYVDNIMVDLNYIIDAKNYQVLLILHNFQTDFNSEWFWTINVVL